MSVALNGTAAQRARQMPRRGHEPLARSSVAGDMADAGKCDLQMAKDDMKREPAVTKPRPHSTGEPHLKLTEKRRRAEKMMGDIERDLERHARISNQ